MAGGKSDLSVQRIAAASLVQFCGNAVSHARDVPEGAPSKRVCVQECQQTYGNLRKAMKRAESSDQELHDRLAKAVDAYDEYMAKHEAAEAMAKDDPKRGAAVKDAEEAMSRLYKITFGLIDAF